MVGEGCGPACKPYDYEKETGTKVEDYVQGAFDVLLSPEIAQQTGNLFCMEDGQSQFLGMSWWVFTYTMTFPPMKWFNNAFEPPVPSQGALDVLGANQAKFYTDACASTSSNVAYANGKWATVHEWDNTLMTFDLPEDDPFVCEDWVDCPEVELPTPPSPSYLRAQKAFGKTLGHL